MAICDGFGAVFVASAVQLRHRGRRPASRDAAWGLGFRGVSAAPIGGDGLVSSPRPCPWVAARRLKLASSLLALSRLPRSGALSSVAVTDDALTRQECNVAAAQREQSGGYGARAVRTS